MTTRLTWTTTDGLSAEPVQLVRSVAPGRAEALSAAVAALEVEVARHWRRGQARLGRMVADR